VTLDPWPLRVIQRADRDGSQARPYLDGMRNGRPTARAELHSEPPSALVGQVFVFPELALENRHVALIEVSDCCKRTAHSTLTKAAMTDLTDLRISSNLISDGAAGTTAFMQRVHALSISNS